MRAPRHDPLVELLLQKGSMTGPHRRTKPLTVTAWQRLSRAVLALIRQLRGVTP